MAYSTTELSMELEIIDLMETDSSESTKDSMTASSAVCATVKTSDEKADFHKSKQKPTMTLEDTEVLIDLTEDNDERSDECEAPSNFVNTLTIEQELSWLSGAIARARKKRSVKCTNIQNVPQKNTCIYDLGSNSSENDLLQIIEDSNQLKNNSTAMDVEEKSSDSLSLYKCSKSINDASSIANASFVMEIEKNSSEAISLATTVNLIDANPPENTPSTMTSESLKTKLTEIIDTNNTIDTNKIQIIDTNPKILNSTEIRDSYRVESNSSTMEFEENTSVSTLSSDLQDTENDSSTVKIDEKTCESSLLSEYDELLNLNSPENDSSTMMTKEKISENKLTKFFDTNPPKNNSSRMKFEAKTSEILNSTEFRDPYRIESDSPIREIEENPSVSTLSSDLQDTENDSSTVKIDEKTCESSLLSEYDELLNLNSPENDSSTMMTKEKISENKLTKFFDTNPPKNNSSMMKFEAKTSEILNSTEFRDPYRIESDSPIREIEENPSVSTLSPDLQDTENDSSTVKIDEKTCELSLLSEYDELLTLNSPENDCLMKEIVEETNESSLSPKPAEDHFSDSPGNDSSPFSKYVELPDPDLLENYSQYDSDEEESEYSSLSRCLKLMDRDTQQYTKDKDDQILLSEKLESCFQAKKAEQKILDLASSKSAELVEVSQSMPENILNLDDTNTSIEANKRNENLYSADDSLSKEITLNSHLTTNDSEETARTKNLDNLEIELTKASTNCSSSSKTSFPSELSAITMAEISKSVFISEPEVFDFSRKTNIETPSKSSSENPENQAPSAIPLVEKEPIKHRIWNPAQPNPDIKTLTNTATHEDDTALDLSLPSVSSEELNSALDIGSDVLENLFSDGNGGEKENDLALLPLKKRKRLSTIDNQPSDDFVPLNTDSFSEDSYLESLQLDTRKINHKNNMDVAYSPTRMLSIANFEGFGPNNTNIDKCVDSDPSIKTNHYKIPVCTEKPHMLHQKKPPLLLLENGHLSYTEKLQLLVSKKYQLSHQELMHQKEPPLPLRENSQLAHQGNTQLTLQSTNVLLEKCQHQHQQNHQHKEQHQELLTKPQQQHYKSIQQITKTVEKNRHYPSPIQKPNESPKQNKQLDSEGKQHSASISQQQTLTEHNHQLNYGNEVIRQNSAFLNIYQPYQSFQMYQGNWEQYLRSEEQNTQRQLQSVQPQSPLEPLPSYDQSFHRTNKRNENLDLPARRVGNSTYAQKRPASQTAQMVVPNPPLVPHQVMTAPQLQVLHPSVSTLETSYIHSRGMHALLQIAQQKIAQQKIAQQKIAIGEQNALLPTVSSYPYFNNHIFQKDVYFASLYNQLNPNYMPNSTTSSEEIKKAPSRSTRGRKRATGTAKKK